MKIMTYVALADVRIVGGGALVAGPVANSTLVHAELRRDEGGRCGLDTVALDASGMRVVQALAVRLPRSVSIAPTISTLSNHTLYVVGGW